MTADLWVTPGDDFGTTKNSHDGHPYPAPILSGSDTVRK